VSTTAASTTTARLGRGYRALLPASLTYDPDLDGGGASGQPRRSTRDWFVDVCFFLFAVAVGAMSYWEAVNEGSVTSTAHRAIDLALGVVACAALWFRRRWPVGVALALLPAGLFSASAGGATIIVIFTVAVHRRFPIAAAVAGLYLASLPVYVMVVSNERDIFVDLTIGLLLTLAVVAWGMMVRARRQLVLSLRERAQRAEAEQQLRVEQARHHERERIAREMHDVLAHRISLLSLHAGALEFRPDAPPAEVSRAAGVIRDSAHQALQDLREVIGILRGDGDLSADGAPARPQPTLADLPGLVEESRQAGMEVKLKNHVDDPGAAPASIGRNAYRIVQEGLTNARKHAPEGAVTLTLAGSAGKGLRIEIRNPLPLRAATGIPGAGAGLVGLTERANLAGGKLKHGRVGREFRLAAWLPWPA